MKERPILFSGSMVRAILEGRKTQTRRVAKTDGLDLVGPCGNSLTGDVFLVGRDWPGNTVSVKCPFGQPGDRLWVRETWAPHADMPPSAIYRCDRGGDYQDTVTPNFRWRPSIHMPRWASRLTLEITAVRVERLQGISEEDAKAEGVTPDNGLRWNQVGYTPRDVFRYLWNGIYDSWDANPWVWAVEFRKVEDNQ